MPLIITPGGQGPWHFKPKYLSILRTESDKILVRILAWMSHLKLQQNYERLG